MKVYYVSQRNYKHQSSTILGVFDDVESANKYCKEDEKDKENNSGDSWEVTSHSFVN